MKYSAFFPSEVPEERIIQIPSGAECWYHVPGFDSDQPNSAVTHYFQVGPENLVDDVVLDALDQLNQRTYFNILRTKEQLGYIVFSGVKSFSRIQGIF